ncbi:MAG: efflux RND transporter permease subunit [Methylococcaceae bacterium]|nr:efflux RND transporter permease subunit [Methylococcaceae bacterium]
MLSLLIRFSIRYYGIILVLAVLILIYGGYRFTTAGLDIFPNFSPKQVIIQTESPGFSAEQVELLVTQPIEKALSGLIGLVTLRSESIQGLSVITVVFTEQSDLYRNRQQVSERLNSISNRLPLGISPPVVVPLSSASATVLTLGLQSDKKNLIDLRSLVDWTIVPRLLAVPGVADVNVFGGAVKQLQIQVNPANLLRFKITLDDVIQAAEQAGKIQGGGFIENHNQRFTLQVSGQPKSTEEFKQIVVQRQKGDNITLGDVADIQFAAEAPISAAQIMGKPGIVLMVIGQYGANTLVVSRAVEQVLAEFDTTFKQQAINLNTRLFRPADYIETSVANLSGHLLIGAGFVLIVLYLFLFSLRSTLIAAVAIPVSLTLAVCILLEAGVNLNIMVLGGLAIALGEVVDDAIIDTENIFRRLRENRLLVNPLPTAEVVYQASIEVRSSVVYASFIVALVFVPLLTLNGIAGRLFAPLGYAYIVAILMSLLVALSLTPALCYWLLSNTSTETPEPPLTRYLKPRYSRLLAWVAKHFKVWLMGSSLLCLFGIASFSQFDNQFLPELREGHYMAHSTSIPGTSLAESIRTGSQLTQQFMAIAGVASVSQWAGRAERGADTYGSHYSEYEIRLKPLSGTEQQQILEQLRGILRNFPGINFEVNTFLTERINETLSGYTAPIVVNIYGNDLTALDAKAQAVANLMQAMPGATDVQLRSPLGTPLLDIKIDLAKLNHYGLRPAQVLDLLQTAYASRVVGKNYEGNKLYTIAVTLPPALRTQLETIGQLPLRTPDGHYITLAQVASVHQSEGRYNILHEGAQRRQTVTCNITHNDLNGFLKQLKAKIAENIHLSADMVITYSGAAIEQATAKRDLLLHALFAGAGALILIFIAIGNSRNLIVTLCNLPFALLGGVLMVMFTQASLSVGSVVGFITLFGITVRNSIMLLSHYQHLVAVEGKSWTLSTAIQGAQERLPSILMTALVTALAMLPVAFNSDNPGREIMGPMAAIIIGGLISSTCLNLLLLPVLLARFGKFEKSN